MQNSWPVCGGVLDAESSGGEWDRSLASVFALLNEVNADMRVMGGTTEAAQVAAAKK